MKVDGGPSGKRKTSKKTAQRADVVKIHDIVENVLMKPIAVGDKDMPIKSILIFLLLIWSLIPFFACLFLKSLKAL